MTKKVLAIFIALIYSIAYIVVGPVIEAQSFQLQASMLWDFVICFILCSVVNVFIVTVAPKLCSDAGVGRISRYIDRFDDRRLFLALWAFIFLSWIPAYLIFYPGVLSYDMISQVSSALGEITNNHHPILHTWLIRCFMRLGEGLFGSYEAGIGILSLLQMLVLSYALARLVMLLKKKRVPLLIVVLTAFFSAFWYMNASLSVTMIKDTLHAAFLVLFVCHFTEIVTEPSEYAGKKRNYLLLPIISFLMCSFRNNGIHIYVFCFAVLMVLRITQIKKVRTYIALIAAILLPVFAFKIYSGPVFEALGIAQGEVREALSVPIQQLQRVAVNGADKLPAFEKERIDYYIDNLEWREWSSGRMYNPFFADPAKSCFYSDHYNEDPIAFWKFYLELGLHHPKDYVVAFLSNTLGYWYPGYYEFSYVEYDNYAPELFAEPLERKSIGDLQIVKEFYESVCASDFWRDTPVLRLFFVPGYTLWFLLFALVLAWRKRGFFTKVLPLYLPLIAQYGIMILSPMSSFRYSWPFYLMLPLVFIGIWGNTETLKLEDEGAKVHPENK